MEKPKTSIKLAFVEDRQEVMDFLLETFSDEQDFICSGRYNNAEEAITFLPRSEPQLVIVDIGLAGVKSGIDCVREVKAKCPEMQFMMFTVFEEGDQIFESLKAGANGYLLKTSDEDEVVGAVRELLEGGAPMSHGIARKVTNYFFSGPGKSSEVEALTKREQEVLGLLSNGLRYREIAEKIDITTGTVKQHVHKIYKKLHVSNKTEAINKYLGR